MQKNDRQMIFYVLGTIIMMVGLFYYLSVMQGQGGTNFFSLNPFDNQGNVTNNSAPDELRFDRPPENSIDLSMDYSVLVTTNQGLFSIDLYELSTPNTVNNFIFLVEQDYYDGTSFHRFVPDLLLQGGSRNTLNNDPEDDKFGGPGYIIEDEINWDSLELNEERKQELQTQGYNSIIGFESQPVEKYSVLMANAGPNTAGSQFFVVLGDADDPQVSEMNGKYTVFGEVSAGRDVIDQMNSLEVDLSNPAEPRTREKITITDIQVVIPE